MNSMRSDKRKTGIPLIGELSWGSHFCQFYRNEAELLDIVIPYFTAGIENNELCIWVTAKSPCSGADDAAAAQFKNHLEQGRVEIITPACWLAMEDSPVGAAVSMLDRSVREGFEGVRFAFSTLGEGLRDDNFSEEWLRDMGRYNVIAFFAYPREEVGAIGFMERMKRHHLALVANAGSWEIIESSEARMKCEDLHWSEEKLRYLFSGMMEGFAYHRIVLDPEGSPCDYVFLEVNEAFERLTGLSAGDILGRRVTEIVPGIAEDPFDWIGKFGEVALTGTPLRFEACSRHLKKWYSVSAFSPHRGFFAVTFSEVTARKEAEQENLKLNEELSKKVVELSVANDSLRNSRLAAMNLMEDALIARREAEETNQRLQALLQALPVGVSFSQDIACRSISGNPALFEQFEITHEDNISASSPDSTAAGRQVRYLSDGCELSVDDLPLQRAVAENRLIGPMEMEVVLPSGRRWFTEATGVPIRDHEGGVVAGLAVTLDITKRKVAEEWLEKEYREIMLAHRFLQTFFRESGDDLYSDALDVMTREMKSAFGVLGYIDEQGILVCPSMSRLLDECEVEGKCINYPPEKWTGLWSRAIREKRALYTNDPPPVPPGHPVILNNLAAPIMFQGKVIGLINLANKETDYTEADREFMVSVADRIAPVFYAHLQRQFREQERMAAEEALRKAHDELEAKVEERTAEIREKDQIMLQQSRQAAMGEMIGNIAHQWRQPLNTLSLLIGTLPMLLERGELSREELAALEEKAMGIIQHMSQTINDFSNYFKPDKEKVPFHAGKAVAKTLNLIRDSFANRGIAIEVETETDPVVNGYPNEFSQVLLNILLNARDALTERRIGNPKVVIRLAAERETAVVTLSDNAGGIPDDIMDKIFDPYFTTKGPEHGTGVGLFMSKGIIEKNMGGRLTARNNENGAEFRIEV